MTLPLKPPVTAAEIPEDWPEVVRGIIIRDGNAVRGPGDKPVIEVKSLTTNKWCLLTLPGGGTEFANYEDRNSVMERIRKP